MKIFYTKDENDLFEISKEVLSESIKRFDSKKGALIFALLGTLGAGKTTFVKFLAKNLKIKDDIKSPTFNLIREYDISFCGFKKMYHIDCYRIEKAKKFFDEYLKEIFDDPESLIIIEWAEKIKRYLPKHNLVTLKFFLLSSSKRKIVLL